MNKYQTVLQFPSTTIEDYDDIVEIENRLIEFLGIDHEIDGHDMGLGEMNIFILTEAPEKLFRAVQKLLSSDSRWSEIRVAYREMASCRYTVLWPKTLKTFSIS
jgi:hypothetical protein